jgi:hypothetical protein
VHGYKWRRPRPWDAGSDAKLEVMKAHFDISL